MQIQSFIQIVQFGRTFCKIFSFWNDFFKVFLFVGIVFITDLSDDFLEQVFQCDHTGGCAIFIKDYCQIDGIFFHFHQKICRTFVFIGKIWVSEKIPYRKRFFRISQNQVFHIQSADDGIC